MAQTHIAEVMFAEHSPCRTGCRDNGKGYCALQLLPLFPSSSKLCVDYGCLWQGGSMIMSALLLTFDSVMAQVSALTAVSSEDVYEYFSF